MEKEITRRDIRSLTNPILDKHVYSCTSEELTCANLQRVSSNVSASAYEGLFVYTSTIFSIPAMYNGFYNSSGIQT